MKTIHLVGLFGAFYYESSDQLLVANSRAIGVMCIMSSFINTDIQLLQCAIAPNTSGR